VGQVIGDILPTAVAVAISPVPVIAVILMLFSSHAERNGLAFVGGWIAGLTAAGAVVLAIAAAADLSSSDGEQPTAAGIVKLVLGVLFLALAYRSWGARPKEGEEPAMPAWMGAIDRFTAAKSVGLGVVLAAVNPKNLALTIAAAISIAGGGLSSGQEVVALVVFIAIASVTVAAPVVVYIAARDQVREPLERAKEWLVANNSTVMAVLLLLIGAKLIGDAIGILSG